jgi:hypothetical protein
MIPTPARRTRTIMAQYELYEPLAISLGVRE